MVKKNKNKQPKNKHSKPNYFSWFIKNLISAVIAAFLLIKVVVPFDDYNYLFRSLRIDMGIIKDYPLKSTTVEQRYFIALSSIYTFFETIKNDSPEDAVILYPEYESFFPENDTLTYKNAGISNKMWAIRFLYPRKIVKISELEHSQYKDKITHVAIVNGFGYEYLPYRDKLNLKDSFNLRTTYGVFPVKITEEELQELAAQL